MTRQHGVWSPVEAENFAPNGDMVDQPWEQPIWRWDLLGDLSISNPS